MINKSRNKVCLSCLFCYCIAIKHEQQAGYVQEVSFDSDMTHHLADTGCHVPSNELPLQSIYQLGTQFVLCDLLSSHKSHETS